MGTCYLSLYTISALLILAYVNQVDAGLLPVSLEVYKNFAEASSGIAKASGKIIDKAKSASETAVDTVKAAPATAVDAAKGAPKAVAEAAKNVAEQITNYVDVVQDGIELNCLGFPKGPLSKTLESILSSETSPEDVRFYYLSRANNNYTTIRVKHFSLKDTDFNIGRETFVLTHGFMSHGQEKWLRRMADALLQYKDVNIFVTDWYKGSNTFNYVGAVASTKIVGEAIAELMKTLKDASPPNIKRGKIHLIGHSLGAHISGRAAYVIKENEKNSWEPWIASRVTGLDPAQPCFQTKDPEFKLTNDDASYVDIYHTNARQIFFFGLGLSEQLGYVDYYPNGGKGQPGCVDVDASFWNFILIPKKLIEESVCSHGRSYIYFTESIINGIKNNCTFIGHIWDRKYENIERLIDTNCQPNEFCPEMGYNSIKYFPRNGGTYFVPTSDDVPHCRINEEDKEKIAEHIKLEGLLDNNFIRYAKELIVGS